MDPKEAVTDAKQFISAVFHDEDITNLGLESIQQIENGWEVTVGFSRPWHKVIGTDSDGYASFERTFKRVLIFDGGPAQMVNYE